MPNRVQWNPRYDMGNETLDSQHRDILTRSNALADHVVATDPESDRKFHETLDELMARIRAHFSTEEALLAECGYAMLDELKDEREEFEFLAADIVTTENFDKLELQRFLALWCAGHIMGSGKKYRSCLADSPVA